MNNCNHPKECLDSHGCCRWCDEISGLESTIAGLRTAIGKTAIIVNGDVTIAGGTVGYLEVRGAVTMEPARSKLPVAVCIPCTASPAPPSPP